MLFFPWSLVALSGLCFFCIGFAWGRRYGQREGVLLGQREAPLMLRQASLLAGYCLLCQQRAGNSLSEPAPVSVLPSPKSSPL